MINLNSLHFDGNFIKREDILKLVSEEQIYVRYIGDEFLNNKVINSPLRTDNVPSFSVFFARNAGKVLWKDFATGETGDCFMLVQKIHGLQNYHESVRLVARDFGFITDTTLPDSKKLQNSQAEKVKTLSRGEVKLDVRYRKAKDYDKQYWSSYGVKPDILRKYYVYPISLIFINDYVIQAPKYCYAYLEYKDGKPTYKVYQPFSEKRYKFTNNNDYSVWEGWAQLPESADVLIITSSRKDVMSIVSTTGIASVALQSENVFPKKHVVDQLKERFKKIYIFYDNDFTAEENWGKAFGQKLATEFDLVPIFIPDEYASKDYSDLVKNHGANTAQKVLSMLLNANS